MFETTLSGQQPLELMKKARAAGYHVGLVFVILRTVDLNIERVAMRVARGGHHIAENIIRRRYENSLNRLAEALRLADETVVMDNTFRQPTVLVRVDVCGTVENHLVSGEAVHARIARALPQALP